MCGLIGTIGFIDKSKLNINTIIHRGPDGFGKWESSEGGSSNWDTHD